VDNQPSKGSHSENEADHKSNADQREGGGEEISIWGFWANHPVAVIGLFVSGILMSSLLEFPGGNPKHLWYFGGGLWALLGVIIYWLISVQVARMKAARPVPVAAGQPQNVPTAPPPVTAPLSFWAGWKWILRDEGVWWLYNDDNLHVRRCPLSLSMLLQIKNTGAGAFTIDDAYFNRYQLEGEYSGQWKPVAYPLIQYGTVLWGGDVKQLFTFNKPIFNVVTKSRVIVPGETIEGWVFLVGKDKAATNDFRITITDLIGNKATEPIACNIPHPAMFEITVPAEEKPFDITPYPEQVPDNLK
jgi:hypothetical protein